MPVRVPKPPAYPATDSVVLYGDKELYARLGKVAEQDGGKTLLDKIDIPIRSGKAWIVKKGNINRIFRCPLFAFKDGSNAGTQRVTLHCYINRLLHHHGKY